MTVESIVLLNLLVATISVWLAMFISARFLRPAILNKKRFALYELRDRLALLAMKGIIHEDSEEYLTLSKLINRQINSTKDFKITMFLQVQYKILSDKKLRQHLDSIVGKLKNRRMPEEYRLLVLEFFDNSKLVYEHKTWLLRNLLTPMIFIVSLISSVVKRVGYFKEFLQKQKSKIEFIDSRIEENRENFSV